MDSYREPWEVDDDTSDTCDILEKTLDHVPALIAPGMTRLHQRQMVTFEQWLDARIESARYVGD